MPAVSKCKCVKSILTHLQDWNLLLLACFNAAATPHIRVASGDTDFIKDILEAARGYKDNPVGDAAIYTPKARIDGGVYNR